MSGIDDNQKFFYTQVTPAGCFKIGVIHPAIEDNGEHTIFTVDLSASGVLALMQDCLDYLAALDLHR